jgi:hypothetical protein
MKEGFRRIERIINNGSILCGVAGILILLAQFILNPDDTHGDDVWIMIFMEIMSSFGLLTAWIVRGFIK